jgi:hypothetical protein
MFINSKANDGSRVLCHLITKQLWRFLEEKVFTIPSTETMFNQYKDVNPLFDKSDAAEIRKENLRKYFQSIRWELPVFIVGEAPGPWGVRFSGVPFTSARALHLELHPRSST